MIMQIISVLELTTNEGALTLCVRGKSLSMCMAETARVEHPAIARDADHHTCVS